MSSVMEKSKTDEVVETFKSWKVSVEGVAPLILHNGQLANPNYEYTKALKGLPRTFNKDDKNDALLQKVMKTTWMGSLYLNDARQIIIPAELWLSALWYAGKRQHKGDIVKTSVYVDGDSVLQYDGPNNPDQLYELEEFRDLFLLEVGKIRLFKGCHPRFNAWSAEIVVQFDAAKFTDDEFKILLDNAGMYRGVGHRRPTLGRFKVTKVEEV